MKQKKAEYFQYPAGLMDDERVVALCLKMGSNDPFAVLVYLLDTMTGRDDFEIVYDDATKGALAWKFRVSEETLETIVDHFVETDVLQINDNRLGCDFLKESLTRLLNYRERQRECGRKGLEKRWGKKTDTQADGATNATKTSIKENGDPMATTWRPYSDPIAKKRREEKSIDNIKKAKAFSSEEENKKTNFPIVEEHDGASKRVPYSEILCLWNETCTSLPKVTKLSDNRKKKMRSRISEMCGDSCTVEQVIDNFRELFVKIELSDFLTGRKKGSRWRASWDWLFGNSTNWMKINEGNYENCRQERYVTLGVGEFIDREGRRTYGTGRTTIPNDAQPRPSERHTWDAQTESWILI